MNTMKTPQYFFHSSIRWDAWIVTVPGSTKYELIVGSDNYRVEHARGLLDAAHPGFAAVYDMLTKLGADQYLATSLLKFCILNSSDERLDKFISRAEIMGPIVNGIDLGLSGDELTSVLLTSALPKIDVELPSDDVFTADN